MLDIIGDGLADLTLMEPSLLVLLPVTSTYPWREMLSLRAIQMCCPRAIMLAGAVRLTIY